MLIGADGASEDLKAQVQARLSSIEDAVAGDVDVSEAMGMSSRELLLTIVVSFATSVAANFATTAIETALADLTAPGTITVVEILPEPDDPEPTSPEPTGPEPDFPRNAITEQDGAPD
ncbi:MAG: hypothetical protein AAF968_00710 [Pseudomonadota bacterium]